MEYSPALVETLTLLSDALDDPITDLQAVLSVLTDDLAAAIPSYLGLTVTLHVQDDSVIVSTLDADPVDVRASLLLPLLPLGASAVTGSVAFYSGSGGAFIDLADDAKWIFNLAGPPVLDAHLPAAGSDPAGIRGLDRAQRPQPGHRGTRRGRTHPPRRPHRTPPARPPRRPEHPGRGRPHCSTPSPARTSSPTTTSLCTGRVRHAARMMFSRRAIATASSLLCAPSLVMID